jgi:hypothetical protein
MNSDYKNFFEDNVRNALYLIVIVTIMIILIYAATQTSLQRKNCAKILKNFPLNYTIKPTDIDEELEMNKIFVKTAYNCCCSGKLKNDYVDVCALKNCADYGVRALDFQVYKLKGKAIISASTVNEIKYKEIYNYLDFNETMEQVNRYFIINNSNNSLEPLFLIFRVYSKSKDTYDQMFTSLNNIFGSSSDKQRIFITNDLANTKFRQLMNKVIILVEYSCINTTYETQCKTAFETSSLSKITSIRLNSANNKIYRQMELIKNNVMEYLQFNSDNSNYINIIYPNLQTNSHNYDFVTSGFACGITFIGLNFQKNDKYLQKLNADTIDPEDGTNIMINSFGSSAFIAQPTISSGTVLTDLADDVAEFKTTVGKANDILKTLNNAVL